MQKTSRPEAATIQPLASRRAPPKRNGRGSTRFLTHCSGRRDTKSAETVLLRGYPAAEAGSPEDLAAISDIVSAAAVKANAGRDRDSPRSRGRSARQDAVLLQVPQSVGGLAEPL